jgi:TonB family protein
MAEPHDVFGACILLKEVFEDDLGHLFRAGTIADEALDRSIWLRVLDGPGLPSQAIMGSFDEAREIADAIRGAQLPAHPLFLDADGVPGLGCDYVPGQPLNRVLARARDEAFPLQPDNALLIVEKLALALTAGASISLAGKPLVHGFLHPGLIYLSNDGEALVTGFGVGPTFLDALEDPNVAHGARAYLAPEALADRSPTQRADVYSLGAILFHLLTGTALPVNPDERAAALTAAHVAWDGEGLAEDIRAILNRALAPAPTGRFASADEFRTELDRLIYGGAYSPTTFNLALFMDRLFRSEIEEDELALKHESEIDVRPYIRIGAEEPEVSVEPDDAGTGDMTYAPEAVPPTGHGGNKKLLWGVLGGAAFIAVAVGVFWLGRGTGPQQPPPEPTPTAAEIAASRQAQDDRLRELTQAMVAEMMAEREEEIRQELIARQTRIIELQQRLQQSERRAAKGTVAAASEAETQKILVAEIAEQEGAQREQEDALEAERQEAMNEAAQQASAENVAIGGSAVTAGDTDPAEEGAQDVQTAENAAALPPPMPTAAPALPTAAPSRVSVKYGDFVKPEDVDTVPVVVKSQSLDWPRNARRSKGKGVVVLQLTVSPSGAVDEVVILRADHTGWGIPESAVEAASGYRYKPGTKDGVAIATHAFITWRYDFTQE